MEGDDYVFLPSETPVFRLTFNINRERGNVSDFSRRISEFPGKMSVEFNHGPKSTLMRKTHTVRGRQRFTDNL